MPYMASNMRQNFQTWLNVPKEAPLQLLQELRLQICGVPEAFTSLSLKADLQVATSAWLAEPATAAVQAQQAPPRDLAAVRHEGVRVEHSSSSIVKSD